MVRVESMVASVSWIPSELVEGTFKLPFELGLMAYDAPPPDTLPTDLGAFRAEHPFRFAQRLSASIEVSDGRITAHEQTGESEIGVTRFRAGGLSFDVPAVAFPRLVPGPEVREHSVTFSQTFGGRPGAPIPRRVRRPPFVAIVSPVVWTTLTLTLHSDGRVESGLAGASLFPRHWVYGGDGHLLGKSGVAEWKEWNATQYGSHTPWGNEDSPAIMTAAETELERRLSTTIMHGGERPDIRRFAKGDVLVEEGSPGTDVFLLLDGVLEVVKDGDVLAEVGPGAVLGERAALEGGVRTATLRALSAGRIAALPAEAIEPSSRDRLRAGHRREDA